MKISDINFTTTKIDMVRNGEILGSATGFFFKHNGLKYLATNRHVVIDKDKKHFPDSLILTLHQKKDDLTKNCEVKLQLYCDKTPLWLQHPHYHEKCDVVLIPLDVTTLEGRYFLYNSLAITFIDSEIINKSELNSFGNLVVVGYPLGFYDEIHNLPVYRKAMIASCYGVNFRECPYFLIDTNLHPGTSGSPVFNSHHTLFKEGSREEGYALFGMHSAGYEVDKIPLGLNVVWYAELLIEIAQPSILSKK